MLDELEDEPRERPLRFHRAPPHSGPPHPNLRHPTNPVISPLQAGPSAHPCPFQCDRQNVFEYGYVKMCGDNFDAKAKQGERGIEEERHDYHTRAYTRLRKPRTMSALSERIGAMEEKMIMTQERLIPDWVRDLRGV